MKNIHNSSKCPNSLEIPIYNKNIFTFQVTNLQVVLKTTAYALRMNFVVLFVVSTLSRLGLIPVEIHTSGSKVWVVKLFKKLSKNNEAKSRIHDFKRRGLSFFVNLLHYSVLYLVGGFTSNNKRRRTFVKLRHCDFVIIFKFASVSHINFSGSNTWIMGFDLFCIL